MTDTLLVSTRKGLFTFRRTRTGGWEVADVAFLGDNVTLAFADERDDTWYAALDHGHFGVKLQRSSDRGRSWQEVGVPEYPAKPEGAPELDPQGRRIAYTLQRIWALEGAGHDRPGELWAGTIPGGLFTRATAASRGSSSRACGTTPIARSGSVVGPTIPASIRCWSTRATRGAC